MKATVKARAREWALGLSSTNKEQIAIMFDYTDPAGEAGSITWFGYFTEDSADRTLDSMRHCGWAGDNLGELDGLSANEVELVLDEEEYNGKVRTKVKWVNRPARLALKTQLNTNQAAAFAARMRGKVVANKQKYGAQPAAQPRTASNGAARGGDAAPWDDAAPPPSDGDFF